jgi:hypothetical protein
VASSYLVALEVVDRQVAFVLGEVLLPDAYKVVAALVYHQT